MTNMEAALKYIGQGWKVFPVKPGDKAPLTSRGFKDASLDRTTIEHWWTEWPDANIGIPTGHENGLVVVDVDAKHDGFNSLQKLVDENVDWPLTRRVRTGGGGAHYLFAYPHGQQIRSRASLVGGVDIRADGGYIVAPPSLHKSGNRYEWQDETAPLAELPSWLLTLLQSPPAKPLAPVDEGSGGKVSEGRNNYLTSVAGRMQDFSGLTLEGLLAINERDCEPPLDEREVETIFKSVSRYQAKNPVATPKSIVKRASSCFDTMLAYLADPTAKFGLATGFPGLDELLGGGRRLGELTALMAVGGTGKSTLYAYMISHLLEKQVAIGYASREMSPETEVLPNILTCIMGEDVLKAQLTATRSGQYRSITDLLPLYFTEGYGPIEFQDLQGWIKELKQEGVQYFFIDHLHFCLEDSEDFKNAVKLTTLLKKMVKDENIHIDIIIQPTKVPEGMSLSAMGLNGLRGGSGIGQAIDNLLILEPKTAENSKNLRKLVVKKCRSRLGSLGEIYLDYDKLTGRFTEVEFEPPPERSEQPPTSYDRMTRVGY